MANPIFPNKPTDGETPTSVMDKYLRNKLLDVDNCLPARIESYDRTTNIATIRPLINKVLADNRVMERAKIYEVQCLCNGGGGYILSFPIKQDDKGWIIAADRDISVFKQSLDIGRPDTGRIHSFSDCWFIPDALRNYVINSEDADCTVLQTADGNVRVVVDRDQVRIVSGASRVIIQDGLITLVAAAVEFQAPESTFTGNVTIQGGLDIEGQVNSPNSATFDGIDTSAHHHKDAENRDTGGALA